MRDGLISDSASEQNSIALQCIYRKLETTAEPNQAITSAQHKYEDDGNVETK
jgi:hypothetical protein